MHDLCHPRCGWAIDELPLIAPPTEVIKMFIIQHLAVPARVSSLYSSSWLAEHLLSLLGHLAGRVRCVSDLSLLIINDKLDMMHKTHMIPSSSQPSLHTRYDLLHCRLCGRSRMMFALALPSIRCPTFSGGRVIDRLFTGRRWEY